MTDNQNNSKYSDEKLLELYQKEWEKTLDIQMHFNDLILRFRLSIISFFAVSLGVIVGYMEKENLIALALPFFVLFIGFLFDRFYYTKLLLSSINHSTKFDNFGEVLGEGDKKYHFFGLTKQIGEKNNSKFLKIILSIMYLTPIIIFCIYVFCIYIL